MSEENTTDANGVFAVDDGNASSHLPDAVTQAVESAVEPIRKRLLGKPTFISKLLTTREGDSGLQRACRTK